MTLQEKAPQAISFDGVIPYLHLSDAGAASAFYKRAFGAVEIDRRPAQDGKRVNLAQDGCQVWSNPRLRPSGGVRGAFGNRG